MIVFSVLGRDSLSGVLSLQDQIASHLAENGTPRFIVPRKVSYFEEHFEAPHRIIGLTDEQGRHMAQAILHAPHVFEMEELGIATLPAYQAGERVSVLQGALVHPDMRGRGVMGDIIRYWIDWAAAENIPHLSARTEASHQASQKNFLRHGFSLIETMVDPRDNARICVFHRPTFL